MPECIQGLVQPAIESLAKQVELNTNEARPDEEYWKNYNKDVFLKKSLEKHRKE